MLQTGFYTVIISDSNGCKNSATQYVQITGLDEGKEAGISVHPNPSNGNFVIEAAQQEIAGEVSINAVNALGQRIFSLDKKVSSPVWKEEIEMNQPAGVYFLQLNSGKFSVVKKITISK